MFFDQPGPRDSPIQCFIKRERATSTYHLYLGLSPGKYSFFFCVNLMGFFIKKIEMERLLLHWIYFLSYLIHYTVCRGFFYFLNFSSVVVFF